MLGRAHSAIFGLFACCQFVLMPSSRGQTAPTTFDRSVAYSQAIEELHLKFATLRTAGNTLIKERQDTLQRLATTKQSISQLAAEQIMSSFALLQSEFETAALQTQLNEAAPTPVDLDMRILNSDVRYAPSTRFSRMVLDAGQSTAINNIANSSVNANIQYDRIRHHIKTLNEAGKLAVERHLSVMQDLERIVNEMRAWDAKALDLFHKYWELADAAGVKCDVELRTALRQCSRTSDDNVGAMLLRAITLVRLDQPDEALPILEKLAAIPITQLFARTIRAETMARAGEKREAIALLRKNAAASASDARIRMHRAQAFAAAGELKSAEAEWDAILKIGGYETAARRALAFINTAHSTLTERHKTTALENAQLAVQLAEDDWASQLALAISTAASGKVPEALTAAESATTLAGGDKIALCQEVLEQIKTGSRPLWKF